MAALSALVLVILLIPTQALAADLRPETIQAWNEYMEAVAARNQEHLMPRSLFLSSDEIPGRATKLRGGEIVVSPAGPRVPLKVSSGLIHDWVGAAFIPNVTLEEVLPAVRSYGRCKEFYHPSVVDSKLIATDELRVQFSMLLMNKSVSAKTALDSDYQSSYTRLDDRRWYSGSD
jgi:hypothetical protein